MTVRETSIKGVVTIEPQIISDARGYFYESFRMDHFCEEVCNTTFVQENQSKSTFGVIRGLHFQKPPYAQSKLVRVIHGTVLDIAVDVRKGSPTYGEHVAVELSAENHRQLFIPKGFAHGFVALSDEAVIQYKCDNYYNKESEGAIQWCDPDLEIDWRIDSNEAIISEKDMQSVRLKDLDTPFQYE